MHKSRSVYRDGYKAHVAIEPDTGLITGCDLTPANDGDGPTGMALIAQETAGIEVLADSAYGAGDSLAAIHAAGHTRSSNPGRSPGTPGWGQINSTGTTSGSTTRLAPSPAPTVSRLTSPNGARPHSERSAGVAPSVNAARPLQRAERSKSASTTSYWRRIANAGAPTPT